MADNCGMTFVFDNVPSEMFGLFIGSFGKNGQTTSSAGSDVTLVTDTVNTRVSPYFYGVKQDTVLTFPMTVVSETPLDRHMVGAIERWLFGQSVYKRLQIMRCDMLDMYFNCFLTSPSNIKVNGETYGFSFTVTCDAPWGWSGELVTEKRTLFGVNTVTVVNQSEDNGFTNPVITLKSSADGQDIEVKNLDDNREAMRFSNVRNGEIITVDNDTKIVTSDIGLNVFDRFNGNFIRLCIGRNR